MPPRITPWTDELLQRLKDLTYLGRTCRQIALELGHGLTRNAVVGKQNRMKYERQNDVTGRPKVRSTSKPVEKPWRKRQFRNMLKFNGHREKPTFYAVNRQVEVLNISFADINDHQCHWCCEGKDEWGPLRCGQPVVFGTKWCPGHARIVYTEGSHEYARAGNLQRQELSQAHSTEQTAFSTGYSSKTT